jgi:hypothetical protein
LDLIMVPTAQPAAAATPEDEAGAVLYDRCAGGPPLFPAGGAPAPPSFNAMRRE